MNIQPESRRQSRRTHPGARWGCDPRIQHHQRVSGGSLPRNAAAALPYIFRARALGLSSLWRDQAGVGDWLDRGLEYDSRLPLTESFGSPTSHAMVAAYAKADEPAILQLPENA